MLGDRTYSLLLSEKEVVWERGQTPLVGSAGTQGTRRDYSIQLQLHSTHYTLYSIMRVAVCLSAAAYELIESTYYFITKDTRILSCFLVYW